MAMRVSQAADVIGVRGIVVHAISRSAREFYLALGFSECPGDHPGDPLMPVATLADIRSALR